MNSKNRLWIAIASTAVAACGGGNPSAPNLGVQIDRMGRAAVNTALTDPFDTVQGQTPDAVKDQYNAASDPSTWATSFASKIAVNLAILDGLDRNCGNQQPLTASQPAGSNRYMPLANVLADDQLYVNANSGTCETYLAVEANATGLVPNSDCGGRTPLENTIDETYSLLAAGALTGVTNGITRDNDGTASLTNFPFLASPN